jgi:hypothetical protein
MKILHHIKRLWSRLKIKCGFLPHPTKMTDEEIEAFLKILSERNSPPTKH